MINSYLTILRFSDLDSIIIKIVYRYTEYFIIREPVATTISCFLLNNNLLLRGVRISRYRLPNEEWLWKERK